MAVYNIDGEQISSSGGGLSETAVTLMSTILRNAVYGTNQSGNITALIETLNGGGGDSPDEPTVSEDVTLENGVMTIISTGSTATLASGVLTIN